MAGVHSSTGYITSTTRNKLQLWKNLTKHHCEMRSSLPELIERGTQAAAGHPVQILPPGPAVGRVSGSTSGRRGLSG
ncbi:hypothetical protein FKM82_000404 [Ascaphus truei]